NKSLREELLSLKTEFKVLKDNQMDLSKQTDKFYHDIKNSNLQIPKNQTINETHDKINIDQYQDNLYQSNSEKIIEIGTRIETEINSELKSEIKSEIKSELKSESTTINDELVISNKEILSEDKQNLQILIDKLCTYFSS